MKGVMVAQIQSSINQFIDNLKETTQAYKEGIYNPQTEQQPKKQPQSNTQTSTQYQSPNYDQPSFNFDTNEAVDNTVNKQSVPKSGKERLFEQKKKEKVWEQNAKTSSDESYKDRLKGKRGRPKKIESIEIADAIVIKETDDSTIIDSLD
jgi:uncharacterized protein involved in type VI secretion and phage assembly